MVKISLQIFISSKYFVHLPLLFRFISSAFQMSRKTSIKDLYCIFFLYLYFILQVDCTGDDTETIKAVCAAWNLSSCEDSELNFTAATNLFYNEQVHPCTFFPISNITASGVEVTGVYFSLLVCLFNYSLIYLFIHYSFIFL